MSRDEIIKKYAHFRYFKNHFSLTERCPGLLLLSRLELSGMEFFKADCGLRDSAESSSALSRRQHRAQLSAVICIFEK